MNTDTLKTALLGIAPINIGLAESEAARDAVTDYENRTSKLSAKIETLDAERKQLIQESMKGDIEAMRSALNMQPDGLILALKLAEHIESKQSVFGILNERRREFAAEQLKIFKARKEEITAQVKSLRLDKTEGALNAALDRDQVYRQARNNYDRYHDHRYMHALTSSELEAVKRLRHQVKAELSE